MTSRRGWSRLSVLLALAFAATACGATPEPKAVDTADWPAVLKQARGQSVDFYTYGGDATLNGFLNGYVADRLAELDIELNQVKVSDTAQVIDTVLGEKQAGRRSNGSVDLVWINGENFATGKQADLWSCGWPEQLPNARFVDLTDPAIAQDFGVDTDGCESAWQQANSALVYDSSRLEPADVTSVDSLFGWAAQHPGRFTYPAPPDFTGSMAVRTILYDTVEDPGALQGDFDQATYEEATGSLWKRLQQVEPSLWRGGDTYPQSQAEVERMYADGEIDAFFTYGPGAVGDQVRKGVFPDTTREAVLSSGNIANTSFVAIPANAKDAAAAQVLANLLQDPQTQLALFKLEGIYPAIDLDKVSAAMRERFADVPISKAVLSLDELSANAQPELSAGYLTQLEKDWKARVLTR
ncbi:MAG: ABC transporter substrate-binding protein [Nocardioidaceae bacterium]|nr:ABC transporter substrate-binding protein [Nocardioidaceae bacterium]